jgi:hypothetical protein
MSIPGVGALHAPTTFSHNGTVPNGFPQSNGVPHNFNIDPVVGGGVSTLYDNATDYNSGFNAVNRPLTQPFLINNERKFNSQHPYYHEAPVFVHRIRRVQSSNPNAINSEHYMLSLPEFNAWLASTEGRKMYGADRTVHKLKSDWRFMGVVKRPPVNKVGIAKNDAAAVIFGGRARMADIGRAYMPEGKAQGKSTKGVPSQRDHMFFLYRRYDMRKRESEALRVALGTSSSSSSSSSSSTYKDTMGIPYFYWQVEVYLNVNGQAPETCLYCDETSNDENEHYVGDYEHVGFINFVYGDRKFELDEVNKARALIKGEEGYAAMLSTMPAIEVFMGVH